MTEAKMEIPDEEKHKQLEKLMKKAQDLLERAQVIQDQLKEAEEGGSKLIRKVQAEMSFLDSLCKSGDPVKENHLKSSNLLHLEALIHTAENMGSLSAVLCPFRFQTNEEHSISISVDVVGQSGTAWFKITARKAEALHSTWLGGGDYGDHDIVQQVQLYQLASQQNKIDFTAPKIHAVFYSGITQDIVDELNELGVTVHGHIYNDVEEAKTDAPSLPVFPVTLSSSSVRLKSSLSTVNLDVTTMIALVSDLSYGGCCYQFKEQYIEELAQQERERPFLPEIRNFLKDKFLIVSEMALKDFKNILATIAGPREKHRAEALLQKVKVVKNALSKRAEGLKESNRIKPNAKMVFGTGDELGAITATANVSFVRAAKRKGVTFSVHIHQSRALTEKKQENQDKAFLPVGAVFTPITSLSLECLTVPPMKERKVTRELSAEDLSISKMDGSPKRVVILDSDRLGESVLSSSLPKGFSDFMYSESFQGSADESSLDEFSGSPPRLKSYQSTQSPDVMVRSNPGGRESLLLCK